jgi:predicted AlkP superfamily phosphohydrolase/phosphomutase
MPRKLHARFVLVAALIAAAGCESIGVGARSGVKRIIVLGIDGMDPAFLERHWDSLPELRKLKADGGFQRLGTTMPPQSPVAWSTFITGLKPAGHGIFDFIHRDPATLSPVSSMAQTTEAQREIHIGSYTLPLSKGEVRNLRQGTPFWKILSDHGVEVRVLRMPTDFPSMECDAHTLSGMGTPDLRGTFGTFTFFTDDEQWSDRKITGGEIAMVKLNNHHTTLRLPGPANSLRQGRPETSVDIEVSVDPKEQVALFRVDEQNVILKRGEWSEWIPTRFSLIPMLAEARGMFRLYVKELHPQFAVYASPINIDPSHPALPVSNPASYSAELAERIGPFHTQGMPYDTAALRHGILDRQEYRRHSRQVSDEALKLLRAGLNEVTSGLLFFHFFGIDQDSHMLWADHEDELLDTYKLVDESIGWVRRQAPDSTLIVMSDHGFARFSRAVHLNAWLEKEGLLTRSGRGENGVSTLANIDWSRTKAYAEGLNALYVNQQFRERDGIVAEGEETEMLIRDLHQRLLEFRDPANGNAVVTAVATVDSSSGDRHPDLIVGYAREYRASWQTALGEIPAALIEDNTDEWRGDHCMDPRVVPGVLLSSRPTRLANPQIEDLTVTILAEFGIDIPSPMKGRNLYSGGPQ